MQNLVAVLNDRYSVVLPLLAESVIIKPVAIQARLSNKYIMQLDYG